LNTVVSISRLITTNSVVVSAGADYVETRSGLAAVYTDGVIISDYKRHEKSAVQACRLCSNNFIGLLYSKVGEGGERSLLNYIL
jgi:hypothetical protein